MKIYEVIQKSAQEINKIGVDDQEQRIGIYDSKEEAINAAKKHGNGDPLIEVREYSASVYDEDEEQTIPDYNTSYDCISF